MLSFHFKLTLEVKPNKSVRFHFHSNFYSEVKPDELARFRIDSFQKSRRTNWLTSKQLPYSEAKPDKPVLFDKIISESQAGNPRTLSIQTLFWKSSRTNR